MCFHYLNSAIKGDPDFNIRVFLLLVFFGFFRFPWRQCPSHYLKENTDTVLLKSTPEFDRGSWPKIAPAVLRGSRTNSLYFQRALMQSDTRQ